MKQLLSETIEKYIYDSEEERKLHVDKMIKNGWTVGSKIKEFTGKMMVDSMNDDKNYVWYAEFFKDNM